MDWPLLAVGGSVWKRKEVGAVYTLFSINKNIKTFFITSSKRSSSPASLKKISFLQPKAVQVCNWKVWFWHHTTYRHHRITRIQGPPYSIWASNTSPKRAPFKILYQPQLLVGFLRKVILTGISHTPEYFPFWV